MRMSVGPVRMLIGVLAVSIIGASIPNSAYAKKSGWMYGPSSDEGGDDSGKIVLGSAAVLAGVCLLVYFFHRGHASSGDGADKQIALYHADHRVGASNYSIAPFLDFPSTGAEDQSLSFSGGLGIHVEF